MTSIGLAQLRAARLVAQGVARAPRPGAAAVLQRMLALQGQDLAAVCWAIGSRGGGTVRDVHAAFDDGSLVRSWPMRGTLHVVPAAELRWMLSLTADRQLRSAARRHAELGIDAEVVERAREVAIAVLSGGRARDRAGFTAALTDAGIAIDGQRAYHLIWRLAITGTIVWGPIRHGVQQLVLCDEWLPADAAVDRDEALGRLLVGYLVGRAPATLGDFAWWAGLTTSDAVRARAVAGSRLIALRHGDLELYVLEETVIPARPSSAVALLPGYDEYLLGYRDRSLVLAAEHAGAVVPGGNGVFQPIVVSRGEVVGVWRRTAGSFLVRLRQFRPLSVAELRSATAAATRHACFSGTAPGAASGIALQIEGEPR